MRREFSAKVKVLAFKRAEGCCEDCGRKLFSGDIRYDHANPDALGGEPTLENCAVLCKSCHRAKTSEKDIPAIAKSNRIRRRHIGIKKPTSFRGWRKMDGTPVWAKDRAKGQF